MVTTAALSQVSQEGAGALHLGQLLLLSQGAGTEAEQPELKLKVMAKPTVPQFQPLKNCV